MRVRMHMYSDIHAHHAHTKLFVEIENVVCLLDCRFVRLFEVLVQDDVPVRVDMYVCIHVCVCMLIVA